MTLLDSFVNLFHLTPFLVMVSGVILGIAVGVMPGITAGMLLALTLPFTYYMSSVNAVILLMSMYVGGVSGGLITATLMRIPGEPNAIMTCLDGFPLAKAGHSGRALGLGNAASIVGGAISWLALVLLAPPLARLAVAFGPWENFALVVMALVLISSLSGGSMLKGLMAGVLGMMVSLPGVDDSSGLLRLSFGIPALTGGLNMLPVIIGVFALSQLIADILNIEQQGGETIKANMRGIVIRLRDYVTHGWNMIRSAIIGVWIGILPGVGATIASIIAYTTARSVSKHPEKFGKGSEEAIVATESANNATTGGTLIPLLTLGIPGGLSDSILLGALVIHNLTPGPLLFVRSPEIVNTIMSTHLVAHVFMFIFMTIGCVLFARLTLIPRGFVFPLVMVFCIVGAYALNNVVFDVWVMIIFGVIGFGLEYARVPLAPFVIGLVLAPIAETQFRSGLMISGGSLAPLYQRPMTLAFLVIAALMFLWPIVRDRLRRRQADI